ncbi:MAG TPA: hypothetical protein VGJ51_16140 [Candidatus Angelobacter sp.]
MKIVRALTVLVLLGSAMTISNADAKPITNVLPAPAALDCCPPCPPLCP